MEVNGARCKGKIRMAEGFKDCDGLRVVVDDVVYMPGLDAPADRPYPFVYFLAIHNDSPIPVTVRGRKWVVKEENGEVIVVEGEGVVGQQPRIEPGACFSYNSYHVVGADAVASGAFFCETGTNERVMVRIPEFVLRVPKLV